VHDTVNSPLAGHTRWAVLAVACQGHHVGMGQPVLSDQHAGVQHCYECGHERWVVHECSAASAAAMVLCASCSFGDVDIALFSAGGSISKKLGPVAQKAGAVVSGSARTRGRMRSYRSVCRTAHQQQQEGCGNSGCILAAGTVISFAAGALQAALHRAG
jgi:hypothetical protein